MNGAGTWQRGFVYLGSQLVAMQANSQVTWVHQEPFTKGQRFTDASGAMTATVIEVDPFGGETARSANSAFQPRKYTSYTRDSDGSDDAMHRRYSAGWSRFSQPDPYDGSYNFTDPQSFNRYSYVQNDPVNLVDPSGLQPCTFDEAGDWCVWGGGPDPIDTDPWSRYVEGAVRPNPFGTSPAGILGGGVHETGHLPQNPTSYSDSDLWS